MSALSKMLSDFAPGQEPLPAIIPDVTVRAAREVVSTKRSGGLLVRSVPIGALANVAVEFDALADLLRRAAVELRSQAEAELKRRE